MFTDKLLPENLILPSEKSLFDRDYFVQLHHDVSAFHTYNYLGARIPLKHSKLNVNKFRELMPGTFDDLSILQFMEFGFPLGLVEDFVLKPVTKNHSSLYQYYTHVDKFVASEVVKGGVTGPFANSPFDPVMVSPMMTAPKKPNSRRTVFDASFSDISLNISMPERMYLGEESD